VSERIAPKPARGMSPVEIMVALVLSLALVAGMGHVAVSSQGTSRSETAQGQAQDTGRVAIELLGRELRKTGYRSDRQLTDAQLFPQQSPFAVSAVVMGDDTSVSMRYLGSGDTWTRSCLGADVANGAMAVQTLFIEGTELRCRARNLRTGTDGTQALLANVEAMAITYGLDDDADGFPDGYVAAASVIDWRQVASINIQLRTVSGEQNVNTAPQPYVGFDGSTVTPTDRRIRRSYSTVVALRNRLP